MKIRAELNRKTNDADCLQMAVFPVNSTIGPEGLCPTLLVFGVIPRPARNTPSLTKIERARAIDSAMGVVSQEQARRRVDFGLRHGGGPNAKEDWNNLEQLPCGAKVAIYRTTSKSWEGPLKFISIDKETEVVQTAKGRAIYRSACVRPWVPISIMDDNNSKS